MGGSNKIRTCWAPF